MDSAIHLFINLHLVFTQDCNLYSNPSPEISCIIDCQTLVEHEEQQNMLEINFIIRRFQLRSDKQNIMNGKMILPTVRYFVAIAKLKFNFATCICLFSYTCRSHRLSRHKNAARTKILLYRVYSHFQSLVYVYYNFHFQLPVLFFNSPGLW